MKPGTILRGIIASIVIMCGAYAQEVTAPTQGPGPGEAPGATLELGGLTFVWCPQGSFEMGSPVDAETLAREFGGAPEWYSDEFPRTKVDIASGFWISRTEVTRAQWIAVTNTTPWGDDVAPSDDVPATQITWEEANAFTREFGELHKCLARLPLESEWEYACRAGSQDSFHFGPNAEPLPLHAQYRLNTLSGRPGSVGVRGPNAWGLFDTLGNAWEWCQDKYGILGTAAPSAGGAGFRIIRGGAANSIAAHLRCSYRTSLRMDSRSPRVGMRLVVEP